MSKAKILVIEDEPGLSEVLKLTLEVAGYTVVVAADGLEALYAFDREEPDLVTLDLNVPKVSGFRLIKLFRKSTRPDVPILIITAYEFEEAEEAVKAGATDFITKPFGLDKLLRKIEFALSKSSSSKEPTTSQHS